MRVMLWNTNNGINQHAQIKYFSSFSPDVAILPELKEKNLDALSPDSAVWVTNNHSNPSPKGLGVLSFNGYEIKELPRDGDMEIFIPLQISKRGFSMNLLAVWNFYWACKQGRFKGVRGENCLEWSALRHYKPMFHDPTLVAGDWNFGPNCFQESFIRLVEVLKGSGIRSLYHTFHKLLPSETNHRTYRSPAKNFYQLDHLFGSKFFCENMNAFHVDNFDKVILSDHAPMIMDVATSEQ